MKTLKIQNSKYGFSYTEGKEYDYTITRNGETVTQDLKYNIVSDMFYNLLSNAEQLESIKTNLTRIADEDIPAGTLQAEYFKRGIETALELINTVTDPNNEIRPEDLSASDWYKRSLCKTTGVNECKNCKDKPCLSATAKKAWVKPEIESLDIRETD